MLSHAIKPINRHQWISEAAYYKALARKFEPGKELADWLEAELDYSNMLIALYISILEEDGPMTILSLQQLATFIGIKNPENIFKEIELVRAIQNETGHIALASDLKSICFAKKWNANGEPSVEN